MERLIVNEVLEVSCDRCSISGLCLPGDLGDADRVALNQIVQRARPVRKGAHLFRAGDRADSVFALRTGSLKSFRVTQEGAEHVTGFFLPGEVVGLESLANGVHTHTAVALDTSLVCRIPLEQFDALSARIPSMRRQLVRVMSRELNEAQERLADARHAGAPATFAGFLLDLADRLRRRGLETRNFTLPMSRGEIASYLGLTQETVSRVIARFQQEGLMVIHAREVRIVDEAAMRALARCGLHGCRPAAE